MVNELFDNIYILNEGIYDLYKNNNIDILVNTVKEENELYKKLPLETLFELNEYCEEIEKSLQTSEIDNYELALYSDKTSLIVRRMISKLQKYISTTNQYSDKSSYNYIYDDKKVYVKNLPELALIDLENKIYTNVEVKYLYFMFLNNNIPRKKQIKIYKKLQYMNTYLEERLLTPDTISIDQEIKVEDYLRNNLWHNIIRKHDELVYCYCINGIERNLEIMSSDYEMDNNYKTEVRKTYIRTLFNYLDNETLDKIKDEYNKAKFIKINEFGINSIKDAFNFVDSDKNMIKKIKTR